MMLIDAEKFSQMFPFLKFVFALRCLGHYLSTIVYYCLLSIVYYNYR